LHCAVPAERVGEVLYRYDKIESQIRLLADTLFLCKVRTCGLVACAHSSRDAE
jgi:hypothetical protein